MKINTQLKEQINFTANEIVIANYILKHKDDVLHMSIQTLAQKTYTSTSAVMRMCSVLGLAGFKEFKIRYAQELSTTDTDSMDIDPNFPISQDDSVGEIAASIKKLSIQTLHESQQVLSIPDIKKACMYLHQANTKAIFGVGDAYLAGLTFQARMTRTGMNYLATPVYGEQNHLAQTMHPGDCALVLSYSGTTASSVGICKTLKERGVPIVSLTSNKDSEIARLSTISIHLPSREHKGNRMASFFSQISMEYCLNIIYSYLYVMDYDERRQKNVDS